MATTKTFCDAPQGGSKMAENAKYTVSQSAVSQGIKEFSNRWKYRCSFCREIGVKYLYGEKFHKVPEENLSIMLGACIERYQNPIMVVIAIMRLIYELTQESFLDRPMYSIRHGWRRIRTKFVLMQVLCFLARGCANDHDTFVRVVMDILTAREKVPVWEAWLHDAPVPEPQDKLPEEIQEVPQLNIKKASFDELLKALKGMPDDDEFEESEEHENCEEEKPVPQTQSEMEPPEDNVPIPQVAPQMQSNVVFLDAAALKEYQNYAATGCDELKQKLQGLDIILPGPSFRDIDAWDPLAWAEIVRLNYGLNVRVEYVPSDKLPWLYTPMHKSGLSKGDYYIVKYAVYFSQLIPGLRVDCATPGVMELYEVEMARIRTREGFMHICTAALSE